MAEYIKLDDAIQAIGEGARIFASSTLNVGAAMLRAFNEIKNADVRENVRGKWQTYYGNEIELDSKGRSMGECYCSVCGDYLVASAEYRCRGNYCPNCGACMRSVKNECSKMENG